MFPAPLRFPPKVGTMQIGRASVSGRSITAGYWPWAPRLHAPRGVVTAIAGTQYSVSDIYLTAPPYAWSGLCLPFMNSYLGQNASNNRAETDGDAATLEDCSVIINGVTTRVTFDGGATGKSLTAGLSFCSDLITSLSGTGGEVIRVRTALYVPTGNLRVGAYRLINALSEGGEYSSTSLAAKVMNGAAIANAASAAPFVYGPASALFGGGKPAGRPSVGTVGDSLFMGVSEASASVNTQGGVGQQGYVHRYLVGQEIGYINMTRDGARALDITGTGSAQGFQRRKEMLDAISTKTGNYALSCILNELGTNDSNSSAATWTSRMTGCIDTLVSLGVPVSMITSFIRTTSATDLWTTTAGQTYVTNYDPTTTPLTTVLGNLAGLVGTKLRGYYNLTPLLDGTLDSVVGAVAGKYRVDLMTSNTIPLGALAGATTITTATPLLQGDSAAIDPGGVIPDQRIVNSVSGNVATLSSALTNAHAVDAVVKTVITTDGLHYSTAAHAYLATRAAGIPAIRALLV